MNGQQQSKMTVALMALSVVTLYIETILQIYVSVTAQKPPLHKTPVAMISLCIVFLSFVISSLSSAYLAHTTINSDGSLSSKIIFKCLHVFCLGLVWRIFKLPTSSSKSNVRHLAVLRLIHVGLQSCPYIIVYSSIFITAGKINVIQILSLLSSVLSSVFGITCYNLRLKLYDDGALEGDEENKEKASRCTNVQATVICTFLGTFLVLSTRLISISLMASQEPNWIFLPLGCHFVVLLVIFMVFSSRIKGSSKVSLGCYVKHFIWGIGMSIVNCFDLIHDKIERLMCKYVGFYSVFLVENIVFLSFWLLRYELDNVGKLVSVVGILSAFVIGLVTKFAGCNIIQQKRSSSIDHPPQTTVLTISSGVSQQNMSSNASDDLVTIVQASLYKKSVRPVATGLHKQTQGKKKKSHRNKEFSDVRVTGRIEEHEDTSQLDRRCLRHDHSMPLNAMSMNQANGHFQQGSDRSGAERVNLDNSLQPESMFNVSDPGTIRSDMMYEEGVDDYYRELENTTARHRSFQGLPLHQGATGFHSHKHSVGKTLAHGWDTAIDSRDLGNVPHLTNSDEHVSPHNIRTRTPTRLNSANLGSLPSNECSDTAISSAKTFPIESKKGDLKAYENPSAYKSILGRKMNKIIFSLEDIAQGNPSTSNVDHGVHHGPNSDDDVFRYKYSNRGFQTARNRISYTEPEDLTSSDKPVSSRGEEPNIKTTIGNSGSQRKTINLSKRSFKTNQNPSPAVILSPSPLQLCESDSSSFTSMTHDNAYTKTSTSSSSSSSSVSTKQFYWAGEAQERRKEQFLPSKTSQIPSSENILRWLASTEEMENEAQV